MFFGILLGTFAIGIMISGAFFFLGQKSLNGAAPGLANGELAPCPASPNCVVSEAHADAKHRVDPLPLAAWEKIPDAVTAAGGEITVNEGIYIAATFTSKTFGFVDDVEFRKSETNVHVRSASRVGYGDAGVNRKRVEALRVALAGQ